MEENADVILKFITCLGSAGVSVMLSRGMQSGMLLHRYALLLEHYSIKWRKRKDRAKRAVLKPLGLCICCYSVWVNLAVYSALEGTDMIVQFAGINFILIDLWVRLEKDY